MPDVRPVFRGPGIARVTVRVSGALVRGGAERWGMYRGCIVTHRIDPVSAAGQFFKNPRMAIRSLYPDLRGGFVCG